MALRMPTHESRQNLRVRLLGHGLENRIIVVSILVHTGIFF